MKRPGFAVLASWLISGAVGLALAAPAHAACNGTWDLTGDWWLNQGNGYAFNLRIKKQNGNDFYGDAKTGYGERQFFSGTFDGQYIEMTIPATGGVYSGGIDDLGHIGGTTHNPDNTESTEWWGDRAATCIVAATPSSPPAPPPPSAPVDPLEQSGVLKNRPGVGDILTQTKPTPPPAGGNPTATVIADVDVYKAAGGGGKSLGVLRSNNNTTKVSLVAPCQDNWCHVKGDPVPTGEGWVYSGTPPDFQSLAF